MKNFLIATSTATFVALGMVGEAQAQLAEETVIAPFAGGPSAVTTSNSYSGLTNLLVSGIGQAAGTSFSDAFYIFTDSNGNIIPPVFANEFGLFINNQIASNFFPAGQQKPAFSANHIYDFPINAPGGALTFGVGDVATGDNTGEFTITLNRDVSIPEPSSILGILALGTLGTASTLKRKLKSSRSSQEETTKVD
jgi:hypothetical protein